MKVFIEPNGSLENLIREKRFHPPHSTGNSERFTPSCSAEITQTLPVLTGRALLERSSDNVVPRGRGEPVHPLVVEPVSGRFLQITGKSTFALVKQ